MPRLIIHAGGGKTGSSFLQHVFALHRKKFSELGLHYPNHPSLENAAKGIPTGGNGIDLADLLSAPCTNENECAVGDYLDRIKEEAESKDVLVSSENMQRLKAPNLKILNEAALRRGYDLTVVFYVRSIAGQAYSGYLQLVKRHRYTKTFAEFSRVYKYPSVNVVKAIADTMSADHFVLRNFDHARSDMFADFCKHVLGTRFSEIQVENKTINRSLSRSQVDYMLELNKHLTSDGQCTNAGYALATANNDEGPTVLSGKEVANLANGINALDSLNAFLEPSEHVDLLGPDMIEGIPDTQVMSSAEINSIIVTAALLKRVFPPK